MKIHKFKISPCSVKSIRNLVKKFEETGCTCNRARSGLSRVFNEVVAKVHNRMITGPLHTARSVSRNLNAPEIALF